MEGKNNLAYLDSRLQELEKRIYGEKGGNNKPVKVNICQTCNVFNPSDRFLMYIMIDSVTIHIVV